MYFSIDRFEGTRAVLIGEDRQTLEVPRSMLPQGVGEGDMLLYENKKFYSAPDKTKERREQVADTLRLLLRKDDKAGE